MIANWLTVIFSVLLSGVVAALVSYKLNNKLMVKARKRDVLWRLIGNLHMLTPPMLQQHPQNRGEPFIALNEAWVVYNDDEEVLDPLKKMHEELHQEGRLADNIVTLVKAMARSVGVSYDQINDRMIERPFTPNK